MFSALPYFETIWQQCLSGSPILICSELNIKLDRKKKTEKLDLRALWGNQRTAHMNNNVLNVQL